MRYALVDAAGTVANIIEWDGKAAYPLPSGSQLVAWATPAGIGSTWNGSTFSAPVAVSSVPQTVTRLQGMLALNAAGLLPQVQNTVTAAGVTTGIWFNNAENWNRTDPVLLQMAKALSLTSAQVDALFQSAATF